MNKLVKSDIKELVEGVLACNRTTVGKAITLVESNTPLHREKAQKLFNALSGHAGKSIRIAITGAPGVGKSTFIEEFGFRLIKSGHKVAVLAVDPSSSITHGSILGDKTRMERLASNKRCFIRPSPSGGVLGGLTGKTREAITVCEAAGFDTIIVETVGVGQNEFTVRKVVDFFMLLLIPGLGDELQGIKRGIMELADILLINKADGDNVKKAMAAKAEYERALHYLRPSTAGWDTRTFTVSSLTGEGMDEIIKAKNKFEKITKDTGVFEKRRKSQILSWMDSILLDNLQKIFSENPIVKEMMPELKDEVLKGLTTPHVAVEKLLQSAGFRGNVKKD